MEVEITEKRHARISAERWHGAALRKICITKNELSTKLEETNRFRNDDEVVLHTTV